MRKRPVREKRPRAKGKRPAAGPPLSAGRALWPPAPCWQSVRACFSCCRIRAFCWPRSRGTPWKRHRMRFLRRKRPGRRPRWKRPPRKGLRPTARRRRSPRRKMAEPGARADSPRRRYSKRTDRPPMPDCLAGKMRQRPVRMPKRLLRTVKGLRRMARRPAI